MMSMMMMMMSCVNVVLNALSLMSEEVGRNESGRVKNKEFTTEDVKIRRNADDAFIDIDTSCAVYHDET